MGAREVVEILRYYQHDLLNELQIVQGYASMGNLDKLQTKLDACIDGYREERQLINLNMPQFTLWAIRMNHSSKNINLCYHIHVENIDLYDMDQELYTSATHIVQQINELGHETELYHLFFEINTTKHFTELNIEFEITGNFSDNELIKRRLTDFFTNRGTKIIIQEGKIALKLTFSMEK